MRRVLLLVLVLALAVAIIAATRSVSSMAATTKIARLQKELKDADLEFARQTAARRLNGWMDFFADDAATIHDGKTVTGKQALRAYDEPVLADKDFADLDTYKSGSRKRWHAWLYLL